MKKLIALALALVMVLGLAVSAFAVTLEKETKDPVDVTTIEKYDGEELILTNGKKTTKYVTIDNANEKALKAGSLKVETTGCCTAEIVKLDGKVEDTVYSGTDLNHYYVLVKADVDASATKGKLLDKDGDEFFDSITATDFELATYKRAKEIADYQNKERKTDKFVVRDDGNLPTVVKITVEENYTAAYKEGKVILTGILASDKKTVLKKEIKVVSDVTIFAYEDVKDAAEDEIVLDGDFDGYSDYNTAKKGYKTADLSEVAVVDDPTVVSTTAFRAIAGKGIAYAAGNVEVEIPEVAAGQKGVNFKYADKYELAKDIDKDGVYDYVDGDAYKNYQFGFKGNQVIASDFTVTLTLDLTWFEAREKFLEKVEENDIITFYVLKDGKLYDKVTVDYKDIDLDENEIELEINGKAGDTLGWYTIQLTAPAEETEENPNTGAESMVGAVIALAVVSVASAAAVSLKK